MGLWDAILESRKTRELGSWRMLAENFQMSVQEFYALLEAAIRTRQVPEAEIGRIEYKESNLLSDRRVYLRVTRGFLRFDCCAAPFGTGYLFSCWHIALPRPFTLFHRLGIIMTCGVFLSLAIREFGLVKGPVLLLVGMAFLYLIARLGVFRAQRSLEDFVLGLSLIGVVHELFFRAPTYFEMDTAYAFNEAVHCSFMEVLEGLSKTHSLRSLTEDELKPIMRDFYKQTVNYD